MNKATIGFLLALVLSVISVTVASIAWPGARLSFLLPAAAVCMAAVLGAYRLCPFRSRPGYYILLVGFTLVVCGILWNINYFTVISGGTFSHPVLHNTDAYTDWHQAVSLMYGDSVPDDILAFRNYSYIIALLLGIFGRDIGVPLMFNALCYGFAIILFAGITFALTRNKQTSLVAMIVASLMCYLMAQATILIKDVPLTMSVAAVACVMVRWNCRLRVSLSDVLFLIVGLVGISLLRPNFLLMLMLGTFILGIKLPKALSSRWLFDSRFVVLFLISVVLFVVMHSCFNATPVSESVGVNGDNLVFVHPQKVRAWDNILVDAYEDMPVWQRILWLPGSLIVQFLIPFPWNFARDMIFGPTLCVAHFGIFWYYAGAVICFGIVAAWRKLSGAMRRLTIWGVVLTILTAYMTSGRVSRYCLVYLPMLLPLAAYTLCEFRNNKKFRIWMVVFTVVLVPVLFVCHHLQMSAT